MPFDFHYKPDGETLKAFMRDDSFFRGLRGHIGSGKSVACAVEVFRRASEQAPHPKTKKRQSRWAVIRNTNPQLETTTIKTWLEWFPEEVFGKMNWSPPYTHHIQIGDLDLEVIFIALDKPADVRKLLSMELTGAWVNEAREVDKSIIDAVTSRVRRFPSRKDGGPGPTWSGVIADTNPPPEEHWWGIMSGDVPPPEYLTQADLLTLSRPPNWNFFTQPSAMLEEWQREELVGYKMNPDRENKHYIPDRYYEEMLSGKTREWINVYVMNRYGHIFEGRPVYPDFSKKLHVASEQIKPFAGQTVYVGIDFGLTPAAVFGQRIRGRWIILRELVAQNMGMTRFAPEMKRFMIENFGSADADFVIVGDPAGDMRVQTDEDTAFKVLRAAGIKARAASTNDPDLRIGAVERQLVKLTDGVPGYIISPCCTALIAAKEGGYHYKDGRDRPEKNKYSHVSDAEQYMMDGAGELMAAVRNKNFNQAPARAKMNLSPRTASGMGSSRWIPRGLG